MLNNSGSSSDNITGGVVGGVMGVVILLLIITAVLCIVCMRMSHKKEALPVNEVVENTVTMERTETVERTETMDQYNTINSRVPATTVLPSYDVSRQTSKDGHNFVQLNEQSYGEGNKRNTINPSTYEVCTGEERVTAFSTITSIRAHQSLSDDTTKECDYAYTHDDQPLHHNAGVNTKISADRDQEQDIQKYHVLESAQSNPVYGVPRQPKSDGPDNESFDGQAHDQSNHTPPTHLPSPPLHANDDEPNSVYEVIT